MSFIKAEGRNLVLDDHAIILKGVGLGGWLLPEGYMWKFSGYYDRPRRIEGLIEDLCGKEYSAHFWKTYYSSFIQEKDFARLAKWGFNSVRLPFNSRLLFDGEKLNPAYLSHLDDAVRWGKKYGLLVFLDCHAAPGGQTGKNIDDSENDYPALFTNKENQNDLVKMWRLLAKRYQNEESVGGYDLLNEPVTKDHDEFSSNLVPLYRRLIKEIRQVDSNHLLVLEGTHWATDFSVFEPIEEAEARNNLLFEFHKYWSAPELASLRPYLALRERLNVPLWDGESGENNLYWYSLLFPLLEREQIGWSFWTYKKMSHSNSLMSFKKPKRWNEILAYEKGKARPKNATNIFDELLISIQSPVFHPETVRSLMCLAPTLIAPEGYDSAEISHPKTKTNVFRKDEPVTVVFADGHVGSPNYAKYAGEKQDPQDKMRVVLNKHDQVRYSFQSKGPAIRIRVQGSGVFTIKIDERTVPNDTATSLIVTKEKHVLSIQALEDSVCLDAITLKKGIL